MAGMMHTCVGLVGGPSGLFGLINKIYSFSDEFLNFNVAERDQSASFSCRLGGPNNEFFDVKCCGPLFKNVLPIGARNTFLQILVKNL